jgi:hypothetical protein
MHPPMPDIIVCEVPILAEPLLTAAPAEVFVSLIVRILAFSLVFGVPSYWIGIRSASRSRHAQAVAPFIASPALPIE